MGDGPLPLTLVELRVPPMNRLAATHARHVDLQRPAARRGSSEHIWQPGAQLEGHRPLPRVTEQQRLRVDDRSQRAPAAFVTQFGVSTQQRAATPIDAAQAGANGGGLHGHLTQSNRSARLIRPEM